MPCDSSCWSRDINLMKLIVYRRVAKDAGAKLRARNLRPPHSYGARAHHGYCSREGDVSYMHITQALPAKDDVTYQQSVGSTGNGIPLSGLIEFASQFESQGSRICWKNLCLLVRAETFSLGCGTSLKMLPTVGVLPKILRG